MLVCPICGYYNPEGSRVCTACGSSLNSARLRACPTCGTLNSIRDAYCLRCLALLPPSEKQLDISLANISDADVAPDPLAALTQSLPEAQLDFSAPPATSSVPVGTLTSGAAAHSSGTGAPESPGKQPEISNWWKGIIWLLVGMLALVPVLYRLTPELKMGVPPAAALDSLSIPLGATVLVSFDYGPAYAAELDRLAEIAVNLLVDQHARFLVMSTQPLGMGSAERVLGAIPTLTMGQDYVLLGYLPGEDAGLRLLLSGFNPTFIRDYRYQQPLSSYHLTQQTTQLAQLSRIIVLSEGAENVQRWVEQVQSQTKIPVDALVSVLAEPQLVPYHLSGQLATLAGGWPAAIEYQGEHNTGTMDISYRLGLAGLAAVVLLFVAATSIRYWINRARSR